MTRLEKIDANIIKRVTLLQMVAALQVVVGEYGIALDITTVNEPDKRGAPVFKNRLTAYKYGKKSIVLNASADYETILTALHRFRKEEFTEVNQRNAMMGMHYYVLIENEYHEVILLDLLRKSSSVEVKVISTNKVLQVAILHDTKDNLKQLKTNCFKG